MGTCDHGCRGECLHEIEIIPAENDVDAFSDDNFCDFVCQFISLDCPRKDKCTEQPCANFALCGNSAPQWLLDSFGGLCSQPCDLIYGRAFEFSSFAEDEACPLCLEAGAASMVYECGHMICAQCYRKAAFSDAAKEALRRCPMCRKFCRMRTRAVMHANLLL